MGRTDTKRSLLPATLAVACLALGGCAPDLTPQSLVDKFRVLALRATPASGGPGEEIVLDVLMSETLSGELPMMLWAACIPLPGQSGRQCLESLADAESVEDRFQFLGLGFEPTATLTLPALADGQEETEVFVVFAACTTFFDIPDCECPGPSCEECLDELDFSEFCDGDDALVFKSVRAHADPSLGNQNPGISGLLIDGGEWAEDHVPEIACEPEGDCPRLELALEAAPGSAEPYTVIRFGEEVEREEEPYVSWFATTGSMSKDRSSVDPETGLAEVGWRLKEGGSGLVTFYFVMYDGRGGLDFAERQALRVTTGP